MSVPLTEAMAMGRIVTVAVARGGAPSVKPTTLHSAFLRAVCFASQGAVLHNAGTAPGIGGGGGRIVPAPPPKPPTVPNTARRGQQRKCSQFLERCLAWSHSTSAPPDRYTVPSGFEAATATSCFGRMTAEPRHPSHNANRHNGNGCGTRSRGRLQVRVTANGKNSPMGVKTP